MNNKLAIVVLFLWVFWCLHYAPRFHEWIKQSTSYYLHREEMDKVRRLMRLELLIETIFAAGVAYMFTCLVVYLF